MRFIPWEMWEDEMDWTREYYLWKSKYKDPLDVYTSRRDVIIIFESGKKGKRGAFTIQEMA